MKIVTSEEMRAIDEATFAALGLPSYTFMENAGRAVASHIEEHYPGRQNIQILCGGGNNGGDGFVVARVLLDLGCSVSVLSIRDSEALHGDAQLAANAYIAAGGRVRYLSDCDESQLLASFEKAELFVDALYGTGFHGELTLAEAFLVRTINALSSPDELPIVSIDIPSGIEGTSGACVPEPVHATSTVAIQYLKLGHVLYPGAKFCGQVYVADVGINECYAPDAAIERTLLTEEQMIESAVKHLSSEKDSHKGTKGHVYVIGGGDGHYGAPQLSGDSALHSGAGLVTLLLPATPARQISPFLSELMAAGLGDDGAGNFGAGAMEDFVNLVSSKKEKKAAIVIGPGMGTGEYSAKLLTAVITYARELQLPLVIDADGLTLLSQQEITLGSNVVLTPHPGEMARLSGTTVADVQSRRAEIAQSVSAAWGCWVVLKGAHSIITGPNGEFFVSPIANDALATAGSGDVLAGTLGALLARGVPISDAVSLGVYLHGASAEVALLRRRATEVVGIVAGDIVQALPEKLRAMLEFPRDPVNHRQYRRVL